MRIHRIGQKRTVTVRRFIVKVSVFIWCSKLFMDEIGKISPQTLKCDL